MLEQISIVAPPINFAATGPGADAANCVLKLEDLLVGYGPLPAVTRITRLTMINEGALDYPTGSAGNVSVGVDPAQRYIIPSGFPMIQRTQPKQSKPLGVLQFYPGQRKDVTQDHNPPICYRKGVDRIVVAPEFYTSVSGQPPISLYLVFNVESDFGDWPLDPANVFLQPITMDTGPSQPTICYRSLVPNIAHGGTKVRVHNAALQSGCTIVHQSIGIQSGSGPNMTAAPVPVLPATSLAGWGEIWGEANLTVSTGQSLLINTTVTGSWGYTDGGPPSWWASDHDSYGEALMGGTVGYQATRMHCVDCVQVLP